MHESKMHDDSSFLTLTYDDEYLPKDGSLSVLDFQGFMKRLRDRLKPLRVRFFACGEYGEKLSRPHYHVILFGYAFPDRVRLESSSKSQLFRSPFLEKVWTAGWSSLGDVTFDSASYVSNYATKKVVGEKAKAHYQGRRPEFLLMSRRPGIGRSWIDRFKGDVYPSDEVIVRGRRCRPPRYYDKVFKESNPLEFEPIQAKREVFAGRLEEVMLKSGKKIQVTMSLNARRMLAQEKIANVKLALKLQSRSMERA